MLKVCPNCGSHGVGYNPEINDHSCVDCGWMGKLDIEEEWG